MILKILFIIVLPWLLLTALPVWSADPDITDCSSPGQTAQTEQEKGRVLTHRQQFNTAYDEAECLRQAAAAKGAEWLETESLLLLSQEAAESGHWEDALALVEKARFQAGQALYQAGYEAEAWKRRVVK